MMRFLLDAAVESAYRVSVPAGGPQLLEGGLSGASQRGASVEFILGCRNGEANAFCRE